MLVLASIYFGDIRKDVTLTSSRYWMMHVSMLTSAYMIAFKLGHVGPFIGRLREQKELERERTQLLASLGLDPLGASLPAHAAQFAGHGAAGAPQPASLVSGGAHQPPLAAANHAVHNDPEFVGGGHAVPLAAAAALPNMQHVHPANLPHHPPPAAVNVPHHAPVHQHPPAPAKHATAHPQPQAPAKHAPAHPQPNAAAKHAPAHPQPQASAKHPPPNQQNGQAQPPQNGVVRGICDGCRGNVMDADDGRVREGDKYYHAACIKGSCGGCHLIVHADAERKKEGGVYWHNDCWLAATHHH